MSTYGYIAHSELRHHGIKGMHWGIRRYQMKDGSLTEEGKKWNLYVTNMIQITKTRRNIKEVSHK